MIFARISEPDIYEAAAYMGMAGDIPASMISRLNSCMKKIKDAAVPKLIFRKAEVKNGEICGFDLAGNSLKTLLKNADEAIIFAATLGFDVDKAINKAQVSDMSEAVILDACASAAIENVCNNFESDMRAEIESEEMKLTYRFSPGYGDLPIDSQKTLSDYLETYKNIGLTVSESMMMTPIKSVIAIMGITK